MSRPARILAYDALRTFAIVSVVAIHSLMPYRELLPPTAPVRVFDDLLHYAVPLFVFISGYFVWSRPLPKEPGAYRRFLSRRVSVILVPYLAWSALYFGLLLIRSSAPPAAGRSVGLLLTGHTWYHLYFIPMLLTFYLLTPLATRIGTRSPELLLVGCYLLRILAGPTIAEAFRSVFGDLGWSYATHVMSHLPHMALGAWFAAREAGLPKRAWFGWALLAGGTAVLLAASLGLTTELPLALKRLVYPGGMAATVLGIVLIARAAEPHLARWANLIEAGAALSFGVYFVHPLLLLGVFGAVSARDAEQLWFQPLFWLAVFAGVTAGSFVVSAGLARLRIGCRLIGLSQPRRPANSA